MKSELLTRKLLAAATFVGVLATAGCHNEDYTKGTAIGDFRDDDEPRQVHKLMAAQVAEGARDDGMLYAHHFRGNELNSLGMQKLESIYASMKPGDVAQVYLVLDPNAAGSNNRRDAVNKYALDRGLAADSVQLAFGENPKYVPAAPILERMDRPVESSGSTSGGLSLMSSSGNAK